MIDPVAASADSTFPDEIAPPPALPDPCARCGTPRAAEAGYCADCGFIFAHDPTRRAAMAMPEGLIAGRYRMLILIGEREGVARFRGEDVGLSDDPVPVIVVRQIAAEAPTKPSRSPGDGSEFEFDLPESVEQATEEIPNPSDSNGWPGAIWEQGILLRAAHLSLPRLIDFFTEDGFTYLVEEVPSGTPLWDAWDANGIINRDRFTWLIQLAEAIDRLHAAGAILEGLRPEMVVVSANGIAILADLADLIPLPLPGDIPLRGGFATAPELLLSPTETDARADQYAFGALMYALLLGRELSDLDFTLTGMPRSYIERVPDANPFLARVMSKTFVRDPAERFPTEDGAMTDPSGFNELIAGLQACRTNLDRVKIDVAAWSTTGIIRSANEDAVSIHHAAEGRLDQSDEAALILLADGMGGMESGEVAAALTLHTLQQCLLASPPFSVALPPTPIPEDPATPIGDVDTSEFPVLGQSSVVNHPLPAPAVDPYSPDRSEDAHGERITTALREANHRVFATARAHPAARGMGCTAEVVLIDGATAIVGHVGDSRVYRMRRGKLGQITRDQTLVSRLVELGQLTEQEAEAHPRRSELAQAIGGRPDVFPDIYSISLEAGDWILVCSDGLSNQLPLAAMQDALREARNAERAARRLINMALFDGAQDNVTVAVVRIC